MLDKLYTAQLQFEASRIGIDGSLADYNTADYLIVRGIIGEATELHDAVLKGDKEEQTKELADILIFSAAIMGALSITPEDLDKAVEYKLRRNEKKYSVEAFQGRTVREAIAYCRATYREDHPSEGLKNE